jgi:hypothetical protein
MQAAQQAQQGQQVERVGGADARDAQAAAATAAAAAAAAAEADAADALAAAWEAAEAAFPHLSVTIVRGASKLSFDCLASTLLQRFAGQPQLAVSLQVGWWMPCILACMSWAFALPVLKSCARCLPCMPLAAAVQAPAGGRHPQPAAGLPVRDPAAGSGGGALRAVPLPPRARQLGGGWGGAHLRHLWGSAGPQSVREG